MWGGGYTGYPSFILIYDNKRTIENNNIYVYLDIAKYRPDSDDIIEGYYETPFSNSIMKVDKNQIFAEDDNSPFKHEPKKMEKFIKENHEKFGKYRMVFTKNSKGSYSFNKLEEVK